MKASHKKSGKRAKKYYGGICRIKAFILAAVIMLCGSFTVLAADIFNNELASEEHNAVREFAPADEKQAAEYWHYQQLWGYQYAIEFDDAVSLAVPHWQDCTRYSWNAWLAANSLNYMGMYYNGKMQISNLHKTYTQDSEGNQVSVGYLDGIDRAAIAYCYYPQKDGTVEMSGTVTESGQGNNSSTYSALIRITVNNSTVYPSDKEWESVKDAEAGRTSLSLGGVCFDVCAGDTVRFEMSTDRHIASGDKMLIGWNPNFIFTDKSLKYTQTDDIYNRLSVFMDGIFRNTESSNLDISSAAKQNAATKAVKEAQYGLYTPLNAVYGSELLPVNEESVWKFVAVKGVEEGFSSTCSDMKLSAEWVAEGLSISWENDENISAVKLILSDGTVKKYNTKAKSLISDIDKTDAPLKIQVTAQNKASEILTVDALSERVTFDGLPIYFDTVLSENEATAGAYFELSSSKASSKYRFFYSTALATPEDTNRRAIYFDASGDEEMRFGFTAPYGGEYEIAAPLSVQSDYGAAVSYSVLKESADGEFTFLQEKAVYSEGDKLCNLIITLNKGDTVWFCAYADAEAVISIGIPTVKLSSSVQASESLREYIYRAIDYMETPQKNTNMTYKSSVRTADSTGVWSFGYFSLPVTVTDGVTDYDALKVADYAIGSDASGLESLFTPYELIRPCEGAGIYNTLPASTRISDGKAQIVTGTFGISGNLHAAKGNTYAQRAVMDEIYRCKGMFGKTGALTHAVTGETLNIGIYMQYTAPISGAAELHLSDETYISSGDRLLILKNGKVISVYSGVISAGEILSLNTLKKGDTVTLCYLQTDGGSNYGYMGMPYIKMTDQWSDVTFSGIEYGKSYKTTLLSGAFASMPSAENKIGQRFVGWYNPQTSKTLKAGTALAVSADTELTAVYNYYGDLNTDGDVNAADLGALKQNVLGYIQGVSENADVKPDGSVNVIDLVRLKKWLAGKPCLLGE